MNRVSDKLRTNKKMMFFLKSLLWISSDKRSRISGKIQDKVHHNVTIFTRLLIHSEIAEETNPWIQ